MVYLNQVNVMLLYNQRNGCLAYVEQLPQISAKGETLAEAKDNLLRKLETFEHETYSNYTVVEYKVKTASFL